MTQAVPKPATGPIICGDVLAARISEECADLALSMDAIQAALGDLLDHGRIDLDASLVRLLQDIDRVTQTLGDLSRLSAALTSTMNHLEISSELVESALKLDSLAERLIPARAP